MTYRLFSSPLSPHNRFSLFYSPRSRGALEEGEEERSRRCGEKGGGLAKNAPQPQQPLPLLPSQLCSLPHLLHSPQHRHRHRRQWWTDDAYVFSSYCGLAVPLRRRQYLQAPFAKEPMPPKLLMKKRLEKKRRRREKKKRQWSGNRMCHQPSLHHGPAVRHRTTAKEGVEHRRHYCCRQSPPRLLPASSSPFLFFASSSSCGCPPPRTAKMRRTAVEARKENNWKTRRIKCAVPAERTPPASSREKKTYYYCSTPSAAHLLLLRFPRRDARKLLTDDCLGWRHPLSRLPPVCPRRRRLLPTEIYHRYARHHYPPPPPPLRANFSSFQWRRSPFHPPPNSRC